MATKTKFPSTKRFGTRYGRKIKYKVGKVEEERKNSKKCPYCLKIKVERVAAGIWYCKKCKTKFTGGAYGTSPRSTIEVKPEEPEVEEKIEKEEEEKVEIAKW